MKLEKLFIGYIYILKEINFKYDPNFAPLSLASTIYNVQFKKRTFLYKKSNNNFIDLCMDDNSEMLSSDNLLYVETNNDFVMIDDNLISFKDVLLKNNINSKYISKSFVKKLTKKLKTGQNYLMVSFFSKINFIKLFLHLHHTKPK